VRSAGFALLALTATVLLGVLALELGLGSADEAASSAAPRLAPAAAAAPTQRPATDRTAEWVATILARPLFSPGRRPPPEGAAPPSVAPTETTDDALPRLTGVLVSPGGRIAIFADPAGGRPIVLQEGGRIGAFAVQAIEAGQVTLAGPAGVSVLRPTFDAGGDAASPAMPAPPLPSPPTPPSPQTGPAAPPSGAAKPAP